MQLQFPIPVMVYAAVMAMVLAVALSESGF
jgi:hypothetical protein